MAFACSGQSSAVVVTVMGVVAVRVAVVAIGHVHVASVPIADRDGPGAANGKTDPMARRPDSLTADELAFLAERHLATLTTLRPDGSPHVVPVGFSYDADAGLARIITFAASRKVHHLADGGRAAVSQVDGGRWLTLEGAARITADPDDVAAAVAGYAARYRQPNERADRVAIEITVDRVLGRA